MKRMLQLLWMVACVCLLGACSDDDDSLLSPSADRITMKGDGGETTVSLASGSWRIAGVINKTYNTDLYGEIYSSEGELLRENTRLQLDGFGQLKFLALPDNGFVITRNDSSSFTIYVDPNFSHEPFEFSVVLQAGVEKQEIVVRQDASDGYTFAKIDYALKEGDGDSLYWRDGIQNNYNVTLPGEAGIYPFSGMQTERFSAFESAQRGAFSWYAEEDSVMVEAPYDIVGGHITLNGEKVLYSQRLTGYPYPTDLMKIVEKISIPVGTSSITSTIEYRRRKITYSLTLKNNRTGDTQVIEGKWIETSPTGNYRIASTL